MYVFLPPVRLSKIYTALSQLLRHPELVLEAVWLKGSEGLLTESVLEFSDKVVLSDIRSINNDHIFKWRV